MIFYIMGKSASGKDSLYKKILSSDLNLNRFSIYTTRPKREGEVDGFHYYFMTQEEFDKKVANGEFLEYAGVYGKSYGTLKSQVEDKFSQGNDVLLDIDWQGNLEVSKYTPSVVS